MGSAGTGRYSVLGVQTANRIARDLAAVEANVRDTLRLMARAIRAYSDFGPPIRLVVLPEFAFQGVPYRSVRDLQKIAVSVPGWLTEQLVEAAEKFNLYIVAGTVIEYDPQVSSHLFNTAPVVGPEGLVGRYRKCNPSPDTEPFTSPFNLEGAESAGSLCLLDLEIGRLGVAICYDNYFPEFWRELGQRGAELVASPSATMHPYHTEGRDSLWRAICRTRCLENGLYGVFVNQGAAASDFPPFAWSGGSFIVDFLGHVVSEVELDGARFVYGEVDLGRMRERRESAAANQFASHARFAPYASLRSSSVLDQLRLRADEELTEAMRARIGSESRAALWGRSMPDRSGTPGTTG